MNPSPLLTIIIPFWNGYPSLEKHLAGVVEQARFVEGGAEVFVVDDAGTIDTERAKSLVERIGSPARWISFPERLGFSGNCNRGAEIAQGRYLLFLNSDMHLEPGCLTAVLQALASREDLFAVTPAILNLREGFWESENRAVFRRGVFDLVFPGRSGSPPAAAGTLRPLAYPCGGALLCRRSHFEAIGGFPEIHAPFYWEDADLGFRARKMGFGASAECGSAIAHHDHAQSIGSHYTKRQVQVIYERNRLLFTWVHLEGIGRWASHLAWLLIRTLAAALRLRPAAVALPLALPRWRSVLAARRSHAQARTGVTKNDPARDENDL